MTPERHSMRGCLAIASQWFGSSVLLLFMLFPFWIAVWLNGLIIAVLVPQLLHSILGVNTLLSTPGGDNRASPQFRFLAFVVRRRMAGT